jgi:hypothetical protein
MRFAESIERANFQNIVDALGEAATFRLFAGALPHRCEDADPPGPVLVEIELGPQPFERSDGKLALTEPLIGKGTEGAGRGKLARSFRLYSADGECITQGSVSARDDLADLTFDNPSVAEQQKVVVSNFDFSMRE